MRSVWIGVLVASGVLVPRLARACTPCVAADVDLIDAEAAYPSNGLVISSYDPATLTVTVDGMAASLDPVGLAWPAASSGLEQVAYRVVPEPQAGSAVEIVAQDPEHCFGDPDEDSVGYVAGAHDDVAPPAATGLQFDLHAFPTMDDDAMCRWPPEAVYWVRGELREPVDGGAVRVRAQLLHDGALVHVEHSVVQPGAFVLPIPLQEAALESWEPTQVCVRVSSLDAAGNQSEVFESCDPCHARLEPADGEPHQEMPDEPAWTDADLWPGGSCASTEPPDEGDTGESDEGAATPPAEQQGGCGCRSGRSSDAPFGLGALLLLLAATRRR